MEPDDTKSGKEIIRGPNQSLVGRSSSLVSRGLRDLTEGTFRDLAEKRRNQMNVGLDPEDFKALATVGMYYFEGGIREFNYWADRVMDEAGDWVEPHLQEVFDHVERVFNEEFEKAEIKTEETAKSPAASLAESQTQGQPAKPQLSQDAARALGKLSPELVWMELESQVAMAIEDHYEEAEKLAAMGWEDPLDDLVYTLNQMFGHTQTLAINYFMESNPDFNLQNISKRDKPLEVLEAIFEMLLTNENLN